MKTLHVVALASVVSFGVGAIAVQGLHAQAKPPAYYIAEVDVSDEDAYSKDWAPKVAETIRAAGGSYVARGTNIQGIEGTPPKRIAISMGTWTSSRPGGNPRRIRAHSRPVTRRSNPCGRTPSRV